MIITIDGPSASGKSTVARLLAHQLGYYYIYSGALFRALAYLLLTNKKYTMKNIDDPNASDVTEIMNVSDFIYTYNDQDKEKVIYKGQDITPFLKEERIDTAASLVSTNPFVRQIVCEYQRNLAATHDSIIDGRDTGSVVFPYADYKFYLTAESSVRAQRWLVQQQCHGKPYTFDQALVSITERDIRDSSRKIAPLTVPVGATVIDNSTLDIQQTVEKMMYVIQHT
jgi:cytidylate kinase